MHKYSYIFKQETNGHRNFYVDHYINYYNYERIKSKLKGMSPVPYRTHALQAA
ncbi:IS3 family transposase [Paenibacillus phytorum]|uniref:IS3 family transposase n=1 Tax=Paenibacillus phytorum TaxID=2654977 RepID=UPI0035E3FC1F